MTHKLPVRHREDGLDLNPLERWLRKMLQAIGLLDDDGWDGAAVCDLLHERPTFPTLPYGIASPRAFRLAWAAATAQQARRGAPDRAR